MKRREGLREYLGVWKYKGDKSKHKAMITNKDKVVHFLPNSTHLDDIIEYYNLLDDPRETIDLSKDRKHKKGIQFWLKKLNALTTPLITTTPTTTPTTPVPVTLDPITSAPTTMSPTKATGNPTTVAPTKSTDPTTGAPTVCENNLDFRVNKKNERSCNWVCIRESRRTNLCKRTQVFRACPISCGLCCADDPKFTFKTETKPHPDKDCVWIAKKYMRRKRYCNKLNIKKVCLFTCSNCYNLVKV